MLEPLQMRAPSKRWLALASIIFVSTGSLAWGFTRLRRASHVEGAPALKRQGSGVRSQGSEPFSSSTSISKAELIDSDNDGIPDAEELRTYQDRDAFRRWFTSIAENQFYRLSDQWKEEQRDCAGLARFAMREALRHHDRPWFQKMGPGYDTVAPDIAEFNLDHNPFGEKIFRTDFGRFSESDLRNGRFSEFVDGRSLKNFNTTFVSRNRREAQPGDLLFFYQPWVQKFPYHVMIFLGPARVAPNGANDWVVYHTGSSPTDKGTVKKVELSVLDHHPDPRWRPVESNKNFLGFYRLKILQ
ncbi:MAG TPA: DUF1175 family protein [Pyrinomonadaceae bacterium]|jgi:uncharacterized protein YfaT (DUF1175 family)|nr:DUF1175 family protein [Pyrinomonadaceae bacterium]